jgi:hypothetical protein
VNSWDSFTRARLSVPFRKLFAFDVEYVYYRSERDYPNQPRITRSNPELRAALAFSLR